MGNDLISRKALEQSIRDYADEVGCNRGEQELANGILKALSKVDEAPTAYDITEVVEKLNNNSHNFYPSIDDYCVSVESVKLDDAIAIAEGKM